MSGSATRAPRALVIGDVMVDYIARLEGPIAVGSDRRAAIARRSGGSAANQAVWLAHFGVGVDFVGRVGRADHERESQALRGAGVEPALAADDELETGRLIALVDPAGERSFLTDRGANDALEAADIPEALLARAALVHLTGYSFVAPSPRAAAIDVIARAAGRPIGVDPASAEFLREIGPENFLEWTRGATMLFPNSEEAAVLAATDDHEAQAARLAAWYPLVVIKRGAAGCEAIAGAQRWRADARAARAIDSTGAGDAFVSAFLTARLRGEPIETGLTRAVAAGAAATEIIGGRPEPGD